MMEKSKLSISVSDRPRSGGCQAEAGIFFLVQEQSEQREAGKRFHQAGEGDSPRFNTCLCKTGLHAIRAGRD